MKKLKSLRVLVTGGRDYGKGDDGRAYVALVKVMNFISANGNRQITVIHGGAKGADAMAGRWADATGTPKEVYPADWYPKNDGVLDRSAGPRRNAEMLTKDIQLVVAFPGDKGTADMVARARAAGVRVYVVENEGVTI